MTNETEAVRAVAWPEYLMIRDTGIHDDMGGLGQRIFTTAGAGYHKEKYVHASEIARLTGEVEAAERWKHGIAASIQAEIDSIEVPKMSELRAEYFKAGCRAAVAAVNKALTQPEADHG